jgi:hypothetical protein
MKAERQTLSSRNLFTAQLQLSFCDSKLDLDYCREPLIATGKRREN